MNGNNGWHTTRCPIFCFVFCFNKGRNEGVEEHYTIATRDYFVVIFIIQR